jgi:hypothetical protein
VTLTEFLTARLDEDAKEARYRADRRLARGRPIGETVANLTIRALRQVEAHRAIVAEHPIADDLSPYSRSCGSGLPFGCETCHEWDGIICGNGYCPTLRHLATMYADHPDYDEAWRP